MSSARDDVMAAIRAGLRGTRPAPLPALLASPQLAVAERAARFREVLQRVGGHCELVADGRAAAARVLAIASAANVRSLALSDAPMLAGITASLPPSLRLLPPDTARDELLLADAGLTTAQWGIAETGTLVLDAAAERHRLASLLPPLHIALLPCSRLLASLGEAFAQLQHRDGLPMSRTITFVTGPSRTADIELELVVGVHGPRSLHVLLLESQ